MWKKLPSLLRAMAVSRSVAVVVADAQGSSADVALGQPVYVDCDRIGLANLLESTIPG